MQRLTRQAADFAPTMPLIMFNPKLVDMQSTGYGLVGRDLRNQVIPPAPPTLPSPHRPLPYTNPAP